MVNFWKCVVFSSDFKGKISWNSGLNGKSGSVCPILWQDIRFFWLPTFVNQAIAIPVCCHLKLVKFMAHAALNKETENGKFE